MDGTPAVGRDMEGITPAEMDQVITSLSTIAQTTEAYFVSQRPIAEDLKVRMRGPVDGSHNEHAV